MKIFNSFWLNVAAFILLLLPLTSNAQLWHRYRHEMFVGVGASQMLGDLGGAPTTAKGFSAMNLSATNLATGIGYRYKISPRASFRTSLNWMRVSGDDSFTENEGRKNRNLSVRTSITEVSPMIEVYLISDDVPRGTRYKGRYFRSRVSGVGVNFSLYVATGVTALYYNPQAEYEGTYYDLRELSTEGQGLEPGTSQYSQVAIAIPVNIGMKLNLDRYWSIGLEGGARFAFTDYLDDVSTDYYDNDAIREAYGDVAAALADRRTVGRGGTGGIRGKDDNDAYFYLQFMVIRRFKSSGRGGVGSRPSF